MATNQATMAMSGIGHMAIDQTRTARISDIVRIAIDRVHLSYMYRVAMTHMTDIIRTAVDQTTTPMSDVIPVAID
jgi:hypothetical protein